MPQGSALRRVLSLSVSNSVGFSGTTSAGLWITLIAAVLPVASWWGSVVGSSQLVAAAVGNLMAPLLFRRSSYEVLARSASVVAAVGNGVMMLTTVPWLYAGGALLTGLALGVLLNCANTLLARSESVQGSYATAQICEVCFSASFYLLGSRIIAAFGLQAIFGLLLSLCLVSAFLMHRLTLNGVTLRLQREAAVRRPPRAAALMAAAAFILFFVGQGSFYQHQVAIGGLIGLGPTEMGTVMASAMIGGFVGAMGGKVLGERFGIVKPPLVASVLLALCLVLVVQTRSQWVFILCAVAIQGLTMLTVPYAFAILAALDESGALPGRGAAMLLLGVAGGPVLSEVFLRAGGYFLVGWAAAALLIVAALLFVAAGRRVALGERPSHASAVPT